MAHFYFHALSSVKKFGGEVGLFLPLHRWFDESRAGHGDFRHRAWRHHTQGIIELEKEFGEHLQTKDGRVIPVRWVGEQHVTEDLGFLPTISDWYSMIKPVPWMGRAQNLSHLGEIPDKERVEEA